MGISFGQTHQDSLVELSLKTKSLQHTIDSLSQEFEKYAIAKDFFSSQMTAVTAIFLFIGAGIILFAGFISFGVVKRKFKNDMEKARTKFENETKELENRISQVKETLTTIAQKVKESLNYAMAKSDLNSLMVLMSDHKKEPLSAYLNLRIAAYFFESGDESTALVMLNTVLSVMESYELSPSDKSTLINPMKSFDNQTIQNAQIKEIIDKIKTKIEL